jgi:hypothetical protein
MATYNFKSIDDKNFVFNDRCYPSLFVAEEHGVTPDGQRLIRVVSIDNSLAELCAPALPHSYDVDGVVYETVQELQVALNSTVKIGSFRRPSDGGGSGSGAASDVTVVQSSFEIIHGDNVQEALNSIDSYLGEIMPAPPVADGKTYAVKDGEWVEVPVSTGSLTEHTNIQSADRPTIETTDPENSEQTVVNEIAYLSDIPAPATRSVTNVTSMFATSVPVKRFQAELHDWGDGNKYVVLRGEDTSGTSNTLVITAESGFGSLKDLTGENALTVHGKLVSAEDGSRSATHYAVDITQETNLSKTTITFAPEIGEFEVLFWVGSSNESYYESTAGIIYRFSIADTPISNLCTSGGTTVPVYINNRGVARRDISRIYFGDDYNTIDEIPNNFLYNFYSLVSIGLKGFINVQKIGNYGLYGCNSLPSIDLSVYNNLNIIGTYFISLSPILKEINIGSVDWSNITIGRSILAETPNVPTSILRADSQELADIVKTKIVSLSDWTVVINN